MKKGFLMKILCYLSIYLSICAPLQASAQEETIKLQVPYIDQRVSYPTGCESVSAVMELQYCGVDISVDEFIDGYLPQGNVPHWERGAMWGCDPRKAFPGDPRTTKGWGCYAPVISQSISRVIEDKNCKYIEMETLNGVSLESLCDTYVKNGTPVIIWATSGMQAPQKGRVFHIEGSGETFTWIRPLHCLVLVGYSSDEYYFNDPQVGQAVAYPKEKAEVAYEGLGAQAIVVAKKQPYQGTPFLDISENWARENIRTIYQNGLISGTPESEFLPNEPVNRGMAVTVLHRLAGRPETTENAAFADVETGVYYESAVNWAYSCGITYGTGDGRFSPNATISYEGFITMLYRYAQRTETELSSADALSWAFENRIIQGNGTEIFDSQESITRAQMATIMANYLNLGKVS